MPPLSSKRKLTPSDGAKGKKARIHAKNPYQEPLDLDELSKASEGRLSGFVSRGPGGELKFAWKDAEAMRALTEVLLERDFGVKMKCHPDRLCPPLPNRLNYVYWLDDLLEHWNRDKKRIHVLDVGVGSNAIYPLLGNKQFGWRFTGSDIDEESLEWAKSKVIPGESAEDIALVKTEQCTAAQEIFSSGSCTDSGALDSSLGKYIDNYDCDEDFDIYRGPIRRALLAMGPEYAEVVKREEKKWVGVRHDHAAARGHKMVIGGSCLDPEPAVSPVLAAVMTNPPFYDLSEPIQPNNHSVCTGSTTEMRTTGGEVAFLAAMVLDSIVLRGHVRWYTCMVGKKASLGLLRGLLTARGVPLTHTTRFQQGRTVRFGLAWSFHTHDPPLSVYATVKEGGGGGGAWAPGRTVAGKVVLTRKGVAASTLPGERGLEGSSLAEAVAARAKSAIHSVEEVAPSLLFAAVGGEEEDPSSGHGSVRGQCGQEDGGSVGPLLRVVATAPPSPASSPPSSSLCVFHVDVWVEALGADGVEVEVAVVGGTACLAANNAGVDARRVLSVFSQALERTNRRWRRALNSAASKEGPRAQGETSGSGKA